MSILYKLTDQEGYTRRGSSNETKWIVGETIEAKGAPYQDLCSDGWLHAYESPELALLLNPIHANIKNPRLWEAEGEIGKKDGQLKCGCRALTLKREIELNITTNQRVAFALLTAKAIYKDASFKLWADNWLSNTDRSKEAAEAEAEAAAWAEAAAEAEAAEAAARAAAEAARAAAEAEAWAATGAAAAARAAAAAARAAAEAAAAWAAAGAAAWAAMGAAWAKVDLITLAKKAMEVE